MAALNRPVKATYEVHESVTVDTLDNEDHTFSGIMFPIKAKQVLPLESVVIHSVSVRGMLGKMSIWVTNEGEAPAEGGEYRIRLTERHWTKVYEREHEASPRTYSVMKFDEPVVLAPGQIRALYIHSTLEGDEAIVYDNSRGLGMVNDRLQPRPRYDDAMITILSGKAHLSNQPFGQVPVWGWGNAWRDHREFVGRLEYGAVYKLWQPDLNVRYGDNFRRSAMRLLACQRKAGSGAPALPDECVYYILNMCRWDWFNDSPAEMKVRRRVLRGRLRRLEMQRLEQERQAEAARASAAAAAVEADRAASKTRGCSCAAAAAAAATAVTSREPPSVKSTQETMGSESDDAAAQVADLDVEDNDSSFAPAAGSEDSDEEEDDDDDDDESEARGDVGEDDDDSGGDDDEDDDGSDESQWERANGYRADGTIFTIHDDSSDDEDEGGADRGGGGGGSNNDNEGLRRNWMDGIRVLRSFANPRGNA